MSILITGIDMPTKGNPITVTIYPDGMAEWEAQNKAGTAIPVPPHGRLIDADAMEKLMSDTVQGDIRGYPYSDTLWDTAFRWIDHQPTIIPAEEAATKDIDAATKPYDLLYEEGGLGIR